MRILLIEDDELLGDGVRAGLSQGGFAVDWVRSGSDAVAAIETSTYDAIVLDLGLPEIPGLEILARLRASGSTTPVLILTARDTVRDRVTGLDSGADDYLVKPFDLGELLARMRALLRRGSGGRAEPAIRHGALVADPAAHSVTLAGAPVDLSPREFAILIELLEHAGRVLSRERLEESLYGWDDELASNAIEVHVHHLRRKLGAELIRTVRGAGYMIPREGEEGE
ncbi:MAG: response regulator [Thermoanaerobaculia bacterium]